MAATPPVVGRLPIVAVIPSSMPHQSATYRSAEERVDGTFEWLLERREYLDWVQGDSSQFLSLTGPPGIGKTIAFSYLFDHVSERLTSQTSPVSLVVYSCHQVSRTRNTAAAIIWGFLSDLMGEEYDLFTGENHEGMSAELLDDLDVLWAALLCYLQRDSRDYMSYFFIDGLDECEESSRQEFLEILERFFDPHKFRDVRAKFLVTCRSGPDTRRLAFGGRIHIGSEEVSADLSRYIQVRVDHLSRVKGYPPELKDHVEETLRRKAGGTYLWVSSVLKHLKGTARLSEVEDGLRTLPPGIKQMCDRVLSRIDNSLMGVVKFMLRLAAMARRPLTVDEFAMAQMLGREGWKENRIPSSRDLAMFQEDYTRCGSLLLVHSEDLTIRFVHETVKDYLVSTYLQTKDGLSQYHVDEDTTNYLMFLICWRYLSMDEFEKGTAIVQRSEDNTLLPRRLSEEFLNAHPFLQYAAQEWQEHAMAAGSALSTTDDTTDPEFIRRNLDEMPTLRDTLLHRAIRDGHDDLIQLLLKNGADHNAKDEFGITALYRAESTGNHEAMQKHLNEKKVSNLFI